MTTPRYMRAAAPRVRAELLPDDRDRVRAALGDDAAKGRLVPFVISTEARASDGHIIRASGWHLEQYQRNPVVLWSHDRSAPRLGDSVVEVRDGVLRAVFSPLPREVSELAYSLGEVAATRGHAASVGFGIVEAEPAPAEVRTEIPWALDITAAELDEWSLVNIGADPLALTARADGVRLRADVERLLDDPMTPLAVRLALLSIWRAAPAGGPVKTTKRADPVSLACPHCGEGLVMGAAPRAVVEVEVEEPSAEGAAAEETSEASAPSPAAPAEEDTEEEPMRGALAGILRAQLARH